MDRTLCLPIKKMTVQSLRRKIISGMRKKYRICSMSIDADCFKLIADDHDLKIEKLDDLCIISTNKENDRDVYGEIFHSLEKIL
ncbi:hypothetical protein MKA27_20855 [[Clostridium] innocuum]|uniref:hypothetical protein n=1 Tax=Clostridium innocuum TaxID=1522 RepID=UPI000D6DB0FF|nr:hypothetical protein [[Clostridium] innocuum]MCR0317211.1 hypothetical protein [[Clostridium] innocuum]MCR0369778.1 hypothetical protein [[Clostridium] innocuum]MCR0376242.1 hypothetical protein [[Clostridium] innocuum]MCR0559731.1 hypothetical protein [[Clostridium] innocuum]MCR0602575.1 hypothetical protein [[Clostridium] innocuum]